MLLRRQTLDLLAQLRAGGVPDAVTQQWVSSLPELLQLEALVRRELDAMTLEAVRAIQFRVAQAQQQALEDASRLVSIALGDASALVAAQFGVVDVGALQQLLGQFQPASPLTQLVGVSEQSLTALRRELTRGIVNGENPLVVARRVAKTTDLPFQRAATIARTEQLRAYRESLRSYYAGAPGVSQWRWTASLSPRTCASCWAMHGQLFEYDEPMGTHPNCRCTMTPVPDREALRSAGIPFPEDTHTVGIREFARLDPGVQREILGVSKAEAYQRGEIRLEDLVRERVTPEWGTTRSVASLADARAAARARV